MKNVHIKKSRNIYAYSLIETMTVIAVLGIVLGLLFAYQEQGWRLFYQSYGRGLSQLKAKTAIRILTDDLKEANKSRIAINSQTSFGVPLPDDAENNMPYIYFTKPNIYEQTGDAISYNYILYYFAKPKEKLFEEIEAKKRLPKEKYLILKSVKLQNQSKHYTEDEEKTWPFLPPLIEIQKSTLPEDEAYIESLKASSESGIKTDSSPLLTNKTKVKAKEQEQFLDHFARLKKESRNIPLSGNFLASSITNPFTTEQLNIIFGQDYKTSRIIKIKVSIEEPPLFLGLMSSMTEFEVTVTPRN